MDTALKDGDFYLGTTGKPIAISGIKELLQRVLIRLTVKKGSFIYDKDLGSDLYTLKNTNKDIKNQAIIMIKEALADMRKIEVEDISIKFTDSSENLKLNVLLSINNNKEEVEILLWVKHMKKY